MFLCFVSAGPIGSLLSPCCRSRITLVVVNPKQHNLPGVAETLYPALHAANVDTLAHNSFQLLGHVM